MIDLTTALSQTEARRLAIAGVSAGGRARYTNHFRVEIAKDDIKITDIPNIIHGTYSPGEFENGAWRYRAETQRMCVVVEFEEDGTVVFVTAWRKKR
ncbi:DUF4258 domain-containing protein [Myxococcota bacterium]|nr:DUF4258 domain-containing protein [Myxococcota bacterium]